jgi:hypothetical protein
VSLRWKYYFTTGSSGPRAQLRLDDILVSCASPALPAAFAGVHLLGTQALQLQFTGSPHRAYALEVSTDLIDWLPWSTVTMDIGGSFGLTDAVEPFVPARFYRLRSP